MLGLLFGLAKKLVRPTINIVGNDIKEEVLEKVASVAQKAVETGQDILNKVCDKCGNLIKKD